MKRNRRSLFLLFTAIFFYTWTPLQICAQSNASLNLTCHNEKLSQVLQTFQTATGIRLVYSNTLVDSFEVTVRTQDTPHRALKKILIATPFDFVKQNPGLWVIVPRSETRALPGELYGWILDKKTGQVISDANVVSVTAARGATADADGRYNLKDLTPGRHFIQVKRIGFEPQEMTVTIPPNDRRHQDFRLSSQPVTTPEIIVEDLRIPKGRQQTLTRQHIGRRELYLPPIRNDGEIFEILHQQPGVSRRDANDVFPHIEGGAATEVAVELDGIPIYVPTYGHNHRSVFAAPTVEGLTLHRAGYGVEHGEAMSGVIEIHSRDIHTLPYSAYSSASLSGVALNFNKTHGKIAWSSMVRSGLSVNDLNLSGFKGHDLFNKLEYQLAANKRLTFLSLFSLGHFQQSNALESDRILSQNMGLRYDYFNEQGQTVSFVVYRSALENRQEESGFKFRMRQPLGSGWGLKSGLALFRLTSNGSVSLDSLGSYKLLLDGLLEPEVFSTPSPDLFDHQTSLMTPYLGLDFEHKAVQANVGLRLPTDMMTNVTRFEPRARLSIQPVQRLHIALSAGRYYQFTDRSYASEVKSGDQFGSGEFLMKISDEPSYSDHLRGEIGVSLTENIDFSAAYFQKWYHFNDRGYLARVNHWTWLLPLHTGRSRGLELWLGRTSGRLQGWLSYTFNPQSFENDAATDFRPYFNREHILNLSMLYYLQSGWRLKGQFLSTSGYPYRDWDPEQFHIDPQMSPTEFVQEYFTRVRNTGALRQFVLGVSRALPGFAPESTINLIAVHTLAERSPQTSLQSDTDLWLSLNLAF